jgi:hypothetical protein
VFLHLAYERYFWLVMALATAAGIVGRQHVEEQAVEDRARSTSPILVRPILVPQR